jgi:peroxiredoxin
MSETIAEQAAALATAFASKAPAHVLTAFAGEQAELDAAGEPSGVIRPGEPMPDGVLLDPLGKELTLAAARGGRPAVVVFYRGAWCPYCNLTLRTYQEELVAELGAQHIGLIAISPQRPDGSLSMQETNQLTYSVLSDPGNQIAGQLGILTGPTDAARAAQADLGLDVAARNADGTHTLPMPTVVLVDSAGAIRWIDVHPNYTTRTESSQIRDAVAANFG